MVNRNELVLARSLKTVPSDFKARATAELFRASKVSSGRQLESNLLVALSFDAWRLPQERQYKYSRSFGEIQLARPMKLF